MSILEISHLGETFELKGSLNKSNVGIFEIHFKDIFKTNNQIVINIDALKNIDNDGVWAFERLYKQSLDCDSKMYITGFGCREMYDHLKSIKVA
jgi:hypothetical protein